MAGITVCVPPGDDAHAYRSIGQKSVAIPYTVSHPERLHRDNPARYRHRRMQPQLARAGIGKWRSPIKHDAGAHPVGMGLGKTHNGSGICHGTGEIPSRGKRIESLQLQIDASVSAGVVGTGKMRHEGDPAYGRIRFERLQRGGKLVGHESEAIHAGIELQKYVQPSPQPGCGQHCQLFAMMNDCA